MLLVTLALQSATFAQFQSNLTTTFATNNNCYGAIFDIQPSTDITICSFDISMAAGLANVRVWAVTGGGTWNTPGVTATPAAWTMLAQVSVVGQGLGVPTPLNLNLGYGILGGTTQGFVIERDVQAAPVIGYNNGVAYGNVLASNTDLTIYEGGGICGTTFSPNAPRTFAGTILYELGVLPTCFLPPPPGEYQANQPAAGLTLDGQPDPGRFAPIAQTSPIGTTVHLDFDSINVGFPFDVAVVPGSLAVPLSGAGVLLGGQVVNVDLANPGLTFAFGGPFPSFSALVFPLPNFSIPFASPVSTMLALQMIIVDPASPDGVSLSHCCSLTVQ